MFFLQAREKEAKKAKAEAKAKAAEAAKVSGVVTLILLCMRIVLYTLIMSRAHVLWSQLILTAIE